MHAHHHSPATGRILIWSLLATAAFVAVELLAGIRAHSLALVSDAGHNATDGLALLLAWFAVYVGSKPADKNKTFGYQRAGVLAAFVNALTLLVLSAWMLYESWLRFLNPVPVNETVMIAVAGMGIVLNGGVMFLLHRSGQNDLNIRGAFIHMLGDLLGSAAIVIGGFAMHLWGRSEIDPILSVLISLLIIWTAWDITRESLNILLEGLPRGMKLDEVATAMQDINGVLDVHDLHIWDLGSSSRALSCHVLIEDMPPSRSEEILHRVNHLLGERFQIFHTTVQFEHVNCALSGTGCIIGVDAGHHHHGHHGHGPPGHVH